MLTLAELKVILAAVPDALVADALFADADDRIADLMRANGPEQIVQAIGALNSSATLAVDGFIVRDFFHAVLATPRAIDERRLLALVGAVLRRYTDACRTNAAAR